ncbi:MAG: protein kinase [Gemmatimonadetes bacterium]|nr:protein kinase [Gemmatimonadota bacterium]
MKRALKDRYAIEGELGSGGMATVYLARDKRLPRQVAIKVLKPEGASRVARQRFMREVEFASQLTHPHIVPIFATGEVDELPYYVMPHITGPTVRDRLREEGALPLADALRIATEIGDALHYAHERGVVHRDVKPENILLSNGHAMIADFGIALAPATPVDDRLTIEGHAIGTPGYMSPEQARGFDIDPRSDLYSLGLVTFEMLSGRHPFDLEARAVPPDAGSGRATPSLRSVGWTACDIIDRAVQRSMAPDRTQRFATVRDFVRMLEPLVGSETDTPAPSALPAAGVAIVVLPFATIGADREDEFFARGITDDILSRVSQDDTLQVTSKTTSMRYRNTPKAVREISAELGAAYVLEGSVRSSGAKVRVVAQLIDAREDKHIWAESYDRTLDDPLGAQEEIADRIALAVVEMLETRRTEAVA